MVQECGTFAPAASICRDHQRSQECNVTEDFQPDHPRWRVRSSGEEKVFAVARGQVVGGQRRSAEQSDGGSERRPG
jgi:hypothetical protein